MDVHDAGDYQVQGAWQTLVPGMVLTVEPGAYIRPADNVPEAFWNIGVRIEDDVLVTANGVENLTAGDAEDRSPTSKPPSASDARRRSRPRQVIHDVAIAGAGPVGATLALALARRRPRRRRRSMRAPPGDDGRAATARSHCRTARG